MVMLSNNCFRTINAYDLIDSVKDDSPSNIKLGVRKPCTGTGFPENHPTVTFYSDELGTNRVELWARDSSLNTSYCEIQLLVGDYGNCDPGTSIEFHTPQNEGIDSVKTHISGYNCLMDSIDYVIPITPNDPYDWWSSLPGYWIKYYSIASAGYQLSVTPSKNIHPLNGLSTLDLVLIQKHLLGIEPLDSPYKIIAADANQDGKVTSFDILILKKLLLGVTTELPNDRSWRFVPALFVFPNPLNPFETPFPESIDVPFSADPMPGWFPFVGIKIGDVNGTADPGE